jgi:hypothetical protein
VKDQVDVLAGSLSDQHSPHVLNQAVKRFRAGKDGLDEVHREVAVKHLEAGQRGPDRNTSRMDWRASRVTCPSSSRRHIRGT